MKKIGMKVCTTAGIMLIILQVISLVGISHNGFSIGIGYTEQEALNMGLSEFEYFLGNVIGYVVFFWMLIIGLVLIIAPRIYYSKRDKKEKMINKSLSEFDQGSKL